MPRRYTLHDTQDDFYTRRCLTLAECGTIMLTAANWRWLIAYDKASPRQRLHGDGLVRRSYALQVVPPHGSKTTVARCDAVNYHDATQQLLEKAARFKFEGTPAARYVVRERRDL